MPPKANWAEPSISMLGRQNMNLVRKYEFRIFRFFFDRVFGNTISTIALTTILSTSIILIANDLKNMIYEYPIVVITSFIILCFIYYKARNENIIVQANLKKDPKLSQWSNNEVRTHIPSIATSTTDGLYLQFMDLPFTLNHELPTSYALEFKSKVIQDCFSWCFNVNTSPKELSGYMIQYNPSKEELRPHFFVGYDPSKMMTKWVEPEIENTPFETIKGLKLICKDGWFSIRTEVKTVKLRNRQVDLEDPEIEKILPKYQDRSGNNVIFTRANINEAIEIRIYDLNQYCRQVYHILINEPPFKILKGNRIGFRNYNLEAAIYSDIKITQLSAS